MQEKQLIYKDKTLVFLSRNTSPGTRTELLNLMGILAFTQYDHYLSLPAMIGKSRIREFQTIADRPIWGSRSHPMAIGGGLATPKAQTKKKKKIIGR
jgi:hypothetical protein